MIGRPLPGRRWFGVAGTTMLVLALAAVPAPPVVHALVDDVLGRPDYEIVRDAYGVPHVFADTREAASFGFGYAQAEDQLWLLHLHRLSAQGRQIGQLESNHATRRELYTAEERARRFATYPLEVQGVVQGFSAGIQARIDDIYLDPVNRMPVEFTVIGTAGGQTPIEPWTVDDTLSIQDLVSHNPTGGAGGEFSSASLLRSLIDRDGETVGRAKWEDLHYLLNPDSPTTVPDDYDWRSESTHARDGEVNAIRALADDARLSLDDPFPVSVPNVPDPTGGPAPSDPPGQPAVIGTIAQLGLSPDWQRPMRDMAARDRAWEQVLTARVGSNMQVVGPELSPYGNSMLTSGPQTPFWAPQFIWEGGIHVPGDWDVSGGTIVGIGPLFYWARGNGYTWALTNGTSDVEDVYVEVLNPGNPREYLFDGAWEPMDCRFEVYQGGWGIPSDVREVCRTRHGPVVSVDDANGLAYSVGKALWDRGVQYVTGFLEMNGARTLTDWMTAALKVPTTYNLGYVDDQGHIGYVSTANGPVRADGVDPRLPQDGTGGSEWQGVVGAQDVPHAVDPPQGWLVNWNNTAARGWEGHHWQAARDRVTALGRALQGIPTPDPYGGLVDDDGMWDGGDVVRNLRFVAFTDDPNNPFAGGRHNVDWYRSALPAAVELSTDLARQALALINAWDGLALNATVANRVFRDWEAAAIEAVFADDLASTSLVSPHDELWMVLSPDATAPLHYDWLNGRDRREVAAEAFEAAVAALAAQHGPDPAGWPTAGGPGETWYTNLSIGLYTVPAYNAYNDYICGLLGLCGLVAQEDIPGYVAPHAPAMNRGAYNHVVVFTDPPSGSGVLGESRVEACSILTPGNSGFINSALEESLHFKDQQDLWVNWQWKPMPRTRDEVEAAARGGDCVPGAVPYPTTVGCDVGAVTQAGDWDVVTAWDATGGLYCEHTGAPTASLELSFAGPWVEVVHGAGKHGGVARVTVDGVEVGVVDFNADGDLALGVGARFSDLGPGPHTLRLTVGAGADPDDKAAYVEAFRFRP